MSHFLSLALLISLTASADPAVAQAPARGDTSNAPDTTHPRSQYAWLCHGQGVT